MADLTDLTDAMTRVLRAGPRLRLAVLFGSVAQGRAHPASDVDVAIVPVDENLALDEELVLERRLAQATGRDIDLVRLDRASAVLRWQVARTGVLLLADPPPEWTRFRVREASAHADIGDALERCTRRFLHTLARPAH